MTPRVITAIAGLLACTLSLPHLARAQSPGTQSRLALAALEARVDQHPSVRRATAAVEEARGLSEQAGKWDNPVVGFAADELRPGESPSGRLGGFVELTVPVGGARGAARDAGQSEVARREAELEAVRLGVLVAIRRSYYAVLSAEERVRVLERQRDLAGETAGVASQLLNIGLADRSDVLLSEAESARAAARLAAAEASRNGAWQALASAAADPELRPGALAVSFDAPLPALSFESVRDEIRRVSPVLRAAEAAVARGRALVAFARTVARPDLFTRGEFGWNREHVPHASSSQAIGWEFGVEFGISLPLANRNTNGIAAANSAVSDSTNTAKSSTSGRTPIHGPNGGSGGNLRTHCTPIDRQPKKLGDSGGHSHRERTHGGGRAARS